MTEIGTVIDGKYEILKEIGRGWHGLSLANEETKCDKDGELPKVQSWMGLSITWIKDLGREY